MDSPFFAFMKRNKSDRKGKNMIYSQKELNREIYAAQARLTDEKLFLSPTYEHKLTEMGHGITNCSFNGKSHMLNQGDDLAFTDGNDIYINYASQIAKTLEKRTEKHRYFLGLNMHEYGHILFTDFKLAEQVREKFKQNVLYPMPKENDYLKELLLFLADETKNAAALQGIHHSLDNAIEDGFVDRAVCKAVPGYSDCLQYSNEVDFANDLISYKEMKNKGIPNPLIFTNLVLSYCVYGEKGYSEEDIENDELLESFEECLTWLRMAVFEARPIERKRLVNTVFCHLFHFIKKEAEKQQEQQKQQQENQQQSQHGQGQNSQNQSGQSGSSEGQNSNCPQNTSQAHADGSNAGEPSGGSPSPSQALNEALSELNGQMTNTEKAAHKNTTAPNEKAIEEIASAMEMAGSESASEGEENESTASANKDKGEGESELSSQLDKIAQDIAISQICEKQEKEIQNNMSCDVKKFLDGVQVHKDIPSNCIRAEVTASAKKLYDMVHQELDTIVRRFIKDFEKEIKDRQLGDTLTGLYAGKRLDGNHLYRSDKRIFSRKIMPEDIPDMAVGILVDCSGSMSGERIEIAQKCAYITYTFCQKMHIPCFVIGHSTSGYTVNLKSVADDKSLDNNDKIRIFGLQAGGSNRDGFALRYCLKKLENIQAKDKLMLVISDGRPAHNGYGMESGQKDCQSAVHDAIKKGIWTIAAGIGYDSASVHEVYKEGRTDNDSASFLDLSDMNRLPKAFVKIIKQRLEKLA